MQPTVHRHLPSRAADTPAAAPPIPAGPHRAPGRVVLAFGPCDITHAIIGALIDRLFPAQVKYAGMGLSANLSAVVAGFMPALATVFLTFSGNASWGRPRC